ncbi:hypothetical protein ACFLS5_01465 [Candidatus Bipolaricaulota bacterium]
MSAQVELFVQLGFENRVTPGHYAPIQVEVRNVRDFGAARLRIVQLVGNEWRGEAAIRQELGYAIHSDGVYAAVIPTYDPVNPIVVELLSSTDTVLASIEIDLRRTMRPTPYPVLDKKISRFDDRAAVIDLASLPTQWWALDSAESLWVASPLPSEAWTAVSQWILAGGSLVLLTGSDFYRMDSPILREFLPLSDPVLADSDRGTTYLSGSLNEATISMLSNEGFPLLIQASYGAGHVSLVTIQAQSLSVETLKNIGEQVASSQLISLRDPTEHILGEQKLVALNPLFVLAMIAVLALGVWACALIGRRNPRMGWIVLLIGVAGLAVSSGFVSNPATHDVPFYLVNTNLQVDIGVGISIVSSSLYSQTNEPFAQPHREGIIPLLFLPRTLTGMDSYDLSTFPERTEMRVLSGKMRHWHVYGAASSMFDVRLLSESMIRIGNHQSSDFDAGWVLIDGMVHSVAQIDRGIHEYSFLPESGVHLAAFVGSADTDDRPMPAIVLIRELRQSFPLEKGVWLIVFDDEEQISSGELTQKVRDITLVAVQGEEEVNREI